MVVELALELPLAPDPLELDAWLDELLALLGPPALALLLTVSNELLPVPDGVEPPLDVEPSVDAEADDVDTPFDTAPLEVVADACPVGNVEFSLWEIGVPSLPAVPQPQRALAVAAMAATVRGWGTFERFFIGGGSGLRVR